MKKFLATLGILALSGCSMLSPYAVTFTTQDESVVDPAEDSLDFVLSVAAYAYISAVSCDDGTNRALAPSFNSTSEPAKVYNLELSALEGVSSGSLCNLTVNVFDKTTSAESRDFISLYVLEKPELDEEVGPVEPDEELPTTEELEVEEPAKEEAVEEPVEESEDPATACEAEGGVWEAFEVSCPEGETCQEGECTYPENVETEPTAEVQE